MFFFLSKTIGVMLIPSNFLAGLGLAGLVLLPTGFAALGRKLVATSMLVLVICGFSPVGKWLLYPLEQRFPPWQDKQGAPPDGIVVLGGAIDADVSAARGVPVSTQAIDRVITAAGLARRYPNARIVFSGGSANLATSDAVKEADVAKTLFESLGFLGDRLIMERRSRNTFENAEFSKALASPKPGERWLLVTSAFHMPRSVGIFRRAGFTVEPYPADWRTGGGKDLVALSDSLADGLERVDLACREWMGLIAYRITGKTDALFPGPDTP